MKQYFAKIEAAEKPAEPRNMSVNTEAATRVIKAGLVCTDLVNPTRNGASELTSRQSDDQALKNKLAEQEAKERAKAFLKSIGKRGPEGEPSSNEGSPAPSSSEKEKSKRRRKNNAQ